MYFLPLPLIFFYSLNLAKDRKIIIKDSEKNYFHYSNSLNKLF